MRLFLPLGIIFIQLFSSNSAATIISIPTDYDSIQLGVEAAADGDTLLVSEGHYYDQINFLGKGILLTSNYLYEPDSVIVANTIIDGSHIAGYDSCSVVMLVSGEDTTSVLQGFTITGGKGTRLLMSAQIKGGGIYIDSSSVRIMHNIIIDNEAGEMDDGVGGGIFANAANNLGIIGNIILSNSVSGWLGGRGGGIYVSGERLIVKDNKIIGNGAGDSNPMFARGAIGGASINSPNCIISGNEFTQNGSVYGPAALALNASDSKLDNNLFMENLRGLGEEGGSVTITLSIDGTNNIIYDNRFINNLGSEYYPGWVNYPSVEIKGENNWFSGNMINEEEIGSIGIAVAGFSHVIDKNILMNCAINGIEICHPYVGEAYDIAIRNNTIYRCGENGIRVGAGQIDTSNIAIVNNIIMESGEYGIYTDSIANPPLIIYNDFYQNESGDFFNCEPSIGNIFVDPLLVAPQDGDFNLQEGSPCIDAGFPGSPLDPDSTRADIGALYFPQMTGIDEPVDPYTPKDIQILANYPNPFNAKTVITYRLPEDADVSLAVYNINGQKVESLVDSPKKAGIYSVTWDGSEYASGVYFYKLKAGDNVFTERMTLLK
ncbi:MAG: T9SS type A sorting domain-containing protein [candidate division Zixibacteria bacterium]|nr:T9SS type A sorting domain-containing protein [candidate division Zixibacteria bacterium]